MRARILGVMAVCLFVGLGIWFMSSRDEVIPTTAQTPGPGTEGLPPSEPPRIPPAVASSSPPVVPAEKLSAPATPGPVVGPRTASPMVAAPPVASTVTSGVQPPPVPMTVSPPPVPTAPGGKPISQEDILLDLDKVMISLRDYRTIMKENPIGTNAEIAKALNGGNPKQARLLQEGLPMNRDGELVDRWGTPYFFHQLSKDHMEIRSAGPDRMLWTEDDTRSN